VHCQWLVAATTILGKNPFCQADKKIPEKHSWCTDRDRTHNPKSCVLILVESTSC
jgi:hypothetical protein